MGSDFAAVAVGADAAQFHGMLRFNDTGRAMMEALARGCTMVELHTTLAGNEHPPKLIEYYRDVRRRMIRLDPSLLEYRFSDEDFYVHLLAHAYKHYLDAGTGLRNLADLFVYLRAKEASMDWDYIRTELEKLEITDFEQ